MLYHPTVHCRWHVRRKENVERVRRDEAEARAKEEELKRRAEIAVRITCVFS